MSSSHSHPPEAIVIGVLALQGAFAEHVAALSRLQSPSAQKIVPRPVRTKEDLATCRALIIPGGESTTIALLARLAGLLEPLREFVRSGKPVWGTCAGAILLADSVEGAKAGGQELLGGMDVRIARNGYGSQVESFEAPLDVDGLRDAEKPFPGVFIRAPVVLSIHHPPMRPKPQIIARVAADLVPVGASDYPPDPLDDPTDPQDDRTVVAVRQGACMLTTFHPELTKDTRFHDYFVRNVVCGSMPR
ncbi:SNO glutamine amidotransferase [Auricularia subglabra TFB-10046 SS5]|nr:SNO glutamine amidotransferase [Auricularia subglabra TFB-10046 SS5]